jgi:hypothetical protein
MKTEEGITDVVVKIIVTPTINFKAIGAIGINICNGTGSVQNSTLTRRIKLQT